MKVVRREWRDGETIFPTANGVVPFRSYRTLRPKPSDSGLDGLPPINLDGEDIALRPMLISAGIVPPRTRLTESMALALMASHDSKQADVDGLEASAQPSSACKAPNSTERSKDASTS